MPDIENPAKKIYLAHGDAIRVVPLHLPDTLHQPTPEVTAAVPAAAPQLTYRGGPLLTAVEVFTVFWGAAWEHTPQSAMITQINQFFDFILTSPLIDQLGEYSVPGQKIDHGKRTDSITITKPTLKHSVSDTAIQHKPGGGPRRPTVVERWWLAVFYMPILVCVVFAVVIIGRLLARNEENFFDRLPSHHRCS